jgi:hypothetical protein
MFSPLAFTANRGMWGV